MNLVRLGDFIPIDPHILNFFRAPPHPDIHSMTDGKHAGITCARNPHIQGAHFGLKADGKGEVSGQTVLEATYGESFD